MQPVSTRPITEKEAAVIHAALVRAPLIDVSPQIINSVPKLLVVGRCECGCDSVDFERHKSTDSAYRIVDGVGYLESGEEIGVMVWAIADEVTGLEVYNYSNDLAHLPAPESICPFEEARIK